MWTYVNARKEPSRRQIWIWTAIVEEKGGGCLMDFEVGNRGEEPFSRLYGRMPEAERYRTDGYEAYKGLLPPKKHTARKGGAVNRNEGLHSMLRSRLNRLMRKTKGYSKSVEMLEYSLALVWPKLQLKLNST